MSRRNERQREYYRRNRDKIYAKQKEYKAQHREEIAAWMKEYHKAYYLLHRQELKDAAIKYKQRIRKSPKHVAQRLLAFARYRAKRDQLPFNLSLDDLNIPDICPVFKTPFVLGAKGNHPYAPSLDRVIPSLGYIKGNVRIISYRANTIKRDASLAELESIVCYMKNNT